jgi:hypothetical protein
MFGSLLLLLLLDVCNGFSPPVRCVPSLRHTQIVIIDAAASDDGGDAVVGIQLVSLTSLGTDHYAVGEAMARSVAAWLDAEWMPQEIHIKMGTSVKNSYVSCRTRGIEEVAEIMTQVTDDLYDRWSEYNADAFVNAWDVGNYVADYLIAKSGSETCGCSTKIVDADVETSFE